MENRIVTSLEQSKKLLELGIDITTADMYYSFDYNIEEYEKDAQIIPQSELRQHFSLFPEDVPAWSLSALLELMPKLYEFEDDPDDGGCQPNLCKGWDNNLWHVVYRYSIYNTEWYNDPIDAAFEMVCWLKENKKI